MTVVLSKNEAKILKYLSERKGHVQVQTIADYFLVSTTTVRSSLKWLVESGLVTEMYVGRKKFFRAAK